VLKELFEETGDDRYASVPCLFKSWHRESEVLLAHLRENDLRGGLTFIDKALAVFDIKALLETELEIDALSQRRLESALHLGGYALSSGLVSRMGYAVHTLLPLIPKALHAGLGRPQVQKIRALESASRQLWQARDLEVKMAFDPVSATLCRRYDDPDWDTGLLRDALETEIAEQADLSVHLVRVELDARIEGRALTIPPPEDDLDADADDGDWFAGSNTSLEPNNPGFLDREPDHPDDQAAADLPPDKPDGGDIDLTSGAPSDGEAGIDESSTDLQYQDTESPLAPPAGVDSSGPVDLKSLRARAWTLAARLAQRNGLSDLVVPLSGQGLGFTLRDVPDPALADQLDEETLSQLSLV
jgi:ParB family protein of integrating conjugative element (PFGI_1 class)